jgi:hypothetical protein
MDLSTPPTALLKNLHVVLVVAFEEVVVSSVAAPVFVILKSPHQPPAPPDRGRMRIQFRKTTVGNRSAEYYGIDWESWAAFNQSSLPGFSYSFS